MKFHIYIHKRYFGFESCHINTYCLILYQIQINALFDIDMADFNILLSNSHLCYNYAIHCYPRYYAVI